MDRPRECHQRGFWNGVRESRMRMHGQIKVAECGFEKPTDGQSADQLTGIGSTDVRTNELPGDATWLSHAAGQRQWWS